MTQQTDRELLRDIESHMRNMWDARLLPANCWPTSLAQRLTAALESKAQDVQMPEPSAYVHTPAFVWRQHVTPVVSFDKRDTEHKNGFYALRTNLYTEQQVRALLSASNSPEFEGVKASERVPLTEAQVFDAAVGTLPGDAHKLIAVTSPEYADTFEIDPGARWTACEVKPEHSLAFARAIERAHGIGKP